MSKVQRIKTSEELTDLGNSKRFNDLMKDKLLYVTKVNEWYRWNGSVWESDSGMGKREGIEAVLEEFDKEIKKFNEALDQDASEKDVEYAEAQIKSIAAARLKLQSERGYNACIRLAATDPAIYRSITEFDSKGHYIGVKNGVVNLKRGSFVQDDPSYLITKKINAAYDPAATCPNWLQQLDLITQGDSERIAFLQRVAGQCLLGTKKDRLLIFTGVGANGKSTYVQAIRELMGDYAVTTDAKMLISDKSPKEYYLAKLNGVRLTTMSETSVEAHMARDLVKNLVDSEGLTARNPAGQPFPFTPVLTPILSTNHIPNVGNDPAVWRRIYVVRFGHIIPLELRDPNFVDNKLRPEFSGILNWMIEGAKQYLEQGLNPPQSVLDDTSAEKAEQDSLQQFIDQYCIVSPEQIVDASAFRRVYMVWRKEHGQKEQGTKTLNSELRAKQFKVEKCSKFGNGMAVFGLGFPAGFNPESEIDTLKRLSSAMDEVLNGPKTSKVEKLKQSFNM